MDELKENFDLDEEVKKAKEFFKSETPGAEGETLYNQLSDVLSLLLSTRPTNPTEVIENFMKESHKKSKTKLWEEVQVLDSRIHVDTEASLFQGDVGDGEGVDLHLDNEEEFETPLPNVMELAFFFEQAGIGLGREEMYKVFLSLKQLVFANSFVSARFWGKIFGLHANYYVAEVEFREGDEGEEEEDKNSRKRRRHKRNKKRRKNKTNPEQNKQGFDLKEETVAQEEEEDQNAEEREEEESEDGGPIEEDNIPKSQWKPPPVIPKEEHHTGTNKKVYFVTTELGRPWTKLPHVTPAQIVAARGIRKFFTGKLDEPIESYPLFAGTEMNYLRAQIARISAGTQISPAGFYVFEENDEDDEENEAHDSFVPNVEFEGLSLRELTDGSMQNWVHHAHHILPQGRCYWFNPFEKPEEDFEDEELDEEEEVEGETARPETGPTLLSPVSDDETLTGSIPAWSVYLSSRVLPEYGVAVVRSNRWPGAYAFAREKKFENIYIGYGHKYFATNYSPPDPPIPFVEYVVGPEVTEVADPTVEEERAVREAQEAANDDGEDGEGGEDEEEEDD